MGGGDLAPPPVIVMELIPSSQLYWINRGVLILCNCSGADFERAKQSSKISFVSRQLHSSLRRSASYGMQSPKLKKLCLITREVETFFRKRPAKLPPSPSI